MNRFNYWPRFKKSLEYHNLDVNAISKLVDVVRRRAGSDRAVDDTFSKLMHVLEPGSCQKSHCDYYGSGGFCGCGKNLVPSKCEDHRQYLERQNARYEKAYQ